MRRDSTDPRITPAGDENIAGHVPVGVSTMTWWAIVVPVITATILVLLPGVIVGHALRARGITAWGLAPALSMTGYTVLGLAYGLVHVPWRLWSVAVGMLVLVAVVSVGAWLLTRTRVGRSRARDPRAVGWAALGGVAVAFVLISARFAVGFGSPDAISQTYDAVFHLNGVRYILDTGDGDPLKFSSLLHAYGGGGASYPNLWHLITSLTVMASGASIPVAVNAVAIVIGGVVWPLSVLLLVRHLLGARPIAMIVGGVLSGSFAAFPLLFVQFGVLYPNLLGVALLPAVLATLVMATGFSRGAQYRPLVPWLLFLLLLPGLLLAHPNAFISLLVIAAPLGIAFGWRWVRSARQRGASASSYVWAAVIAVVLLVVGVVAFVKMRPSQSSASWHPTLGPRQAAWNALVNAQFWPAAFAVSILVVIGVIAVFVTRRNRWLVASVVLVDALYVATAYLPVGSLRYFVTGTWYSDVFRLVALGPTLLVPLATIGVLWLGRLFGRWMTSANTASRSVVVARRGAAASVVIVIVAGVAAQVGPSLTTETGNTRATYAATERSALLSPDERTLLERVAKEVPKGAVIAGDPWTGTSLVWALADRRALVPNIKGSESPSVALIMNDLNTATPGSAVCDAVRANNVRYVLDFGTNGVFGAVDDNFGVHDMGSSQAVKLVDSQGDAALYRITACY